MIPPGTTSASVGSSTKYKSRKRKILKSYESVRGAYTQWTKIQKKVQFREAATFGVALFEKIF